MFQRPARPDGLEIYRFNPFRESHYRMIRNNVFHTINAYNDVHNE